MADQIRGLATLTKCEIKSELGLLTKQVSRAYQTGAITEEEFEDCISAINMLVNIMIEEGKKNG